MNISIILPTYNEKGNILILIERIVKVLKKLKKSYEIIVVDDNSPDETGYIAEKKYKDNRNLKVFIRKRDRGFASAILHGIKKSKGKIVFVMDTDFSHNPGLIPKMLSKIQDCDVVIASRYAEGGGGENKSRYWLSKLYNTYLRLLLGINISDFLFGYFCVRKDFLIKNKILNKKVFFGFGDYFIRLAFYVNTAGGRFYEIPAYYKNRIYGKTKSNLVKMLITYTKTSLDLLLTSK